MHSWSNRFLKLRSNQICPNTDQLQKPLGHATFLEEAVDERHGEEQCLGLVDENFMNIDNPID